MRLSELQIELLKRAFTQGYLSYSDVCKVYDMNSKDKANRILLGLKLRGLLLRDGNEWFLTNKAKMYLKEYERR